MWVLIGGIHLVWALCVAIIPTACQSFVNWILEIHFIQPLWFVTPFVFWKMIVVVIFTFIVGCIVWWLIGLMLNSVMMIKKE